MEKTARYILPPLFYLGVALLGGSFTARGMDGWYQSLLKPSFTPQGGTIGAAWTAIYVMAALSMILFLKSGAPGRKLAVVVGLYLINGIANAAWSWIFFDRQMLGLAVLDAGYIAITVALIMVYVWRYSRLSCILLAPYLAWVCFAVYLASVIYGLNARG